MIGDRYDHDERDVQYDPRDGNCSLLKGKSDLRSPRKIRHFGELDTTMGGT